MWVRRRAEGQDELHEEKRGSVSDPPDALSRA